jgi:hypothetical protein
LFIPGRNPGKPQTIKTGITEQWEILQAPDAGTGMIPVPLGDKKDSEFCLSGHSVSFSNMKE